MIFFRQPRLRAEASVLRRQDAQRAAPLAGVLRFALVPLLRGAAVALAGSLEPEQIVALLQTLVAAVPEAGLGLDVLLEPICFKRKMSKIS